MNNLECKNCCYYSESPEANGFHCCFNEWGHSDYEVAPCDEDYYADEDVYEEY